MIGQVFDAITGVVGDTAAGIAAAGGWFGTFGAPNAGGPGDEVVWIPNYGFLRLGCPEWATMDRRIIRRNRSRNHAPCRTRATTMIASWRAAAPAPDGGLDCFYECLNGSNFWWHIGPGEGGCPQSARYEP